jgi:short-subunit dehydrogenase
MATSYNLSIMKCTILITGAGSGIGKDAALALVKRGHQVIATTHTPEQASALKTFFKQEEVEVDVVKLDITKAADIAAALHFKPDILINNAGHGESGPITEIPMDRARNIFDINVLGTIDVTQQFVKHMLKQKHGRVITVTSTAGLIVVPYLGIYHATKFALEAAFDAFRLELKPRGVQVSLIEPGLILTGFNERMAATKYTWLKPSSFFANDRPKMEKHDAELPASSYPSDSVVKAIVHAVEARRPKARYIAPRKYKYMIAVANSLPTRLKDRVMRKAFGL